MGFRQERERESHKILFRILKLQHTYGKTTNVYIYTYVYTLLLFICKDNISITTLLHILVLHSPLSIVVRFHSCNTFDLSRESLRALLRDTSLTHSARDRPHLTPQINFDLDLLIPFQVPFPDIEIVKILLFLLRFSFNREMTLSAPIFRYPC